MLELDLSPFPVLRTERMVMRELTLADGDLMYGMRSDPALMEHIGRPRATTLQDALDLIERSVSDRRNNTGITWAMTLHGDDAMIGTIGYYRLKPEHYRGEIGYMLRKEFWGRGLMSEALEAAVRHGFDSIGFHSIEAITDPANTRSIRILERNGFVREGLFKENYYYDGKFYDSAVFSRLNGK